MSDRDNELFAAAKKINARDYQGVVYCENGPSSPSMGDCYYANVREFVDACTENGVRIPLFVWACSSRVPETDVDDMIEASLEGHYEDAKYDLDGEHVEKLREFMSAWWRDSGIVSYRPDRELAVVLDLASL